MKMSGLQHINDKHISVKKETSIRTNTLQ